jgi:hypothetical protein
MRRRGVGGGTGRVAVRFRLSLFRAPLTAAAPALFFVACLMTRELPSSIGRIDDAPGVAAALTMPLTLFHRQRQCLRSGILCRDQAACRPRQARRAVVVLAALLLIKFAILYAWAFPVCPKKAMGCAESR